MLAMLNLVTETTNYTDDNCNIYVASRLIATIDPTFSKSLANAMHQLDVHYIPSIFDI